MLKMSLDLFVCITRERVPSRTDHFVNVFACENLYTLWWCYGVQKFNAEAILFGENKWKENGV